jgi:peptidoglycan hydrolase CwlO-like protein
MIGNLEAIRAQRQRKERLVWKIDENVKELKAGIDETKELLGKLNKRIAKLCSSVEDLLGKNIKRRVIVTKTTF